MKHKTLARIAIIMVIVFGVITISYPLLFNPNDPSVETPVGESQPGPDDLKGNPSNN